MQLARLCSRTHVINPVPASSDRPSGKPLAENSSGPLLHCPDSGVQLDM